MTTDLALCRCGRPPCMIQKRNFNINSIRIECACGNHGGTLMYTKPGDEQKMKQAAADGWALAQG